MKYSRDLTQINFNGYGDDCQIHMLKPDDIKISIELSILDLPFRSIRIPPNA